MAAGAGGFQAGMRLDYLLSIVNELLASKELESILGSPLEKHVALTVENGRFHFRQLTPFGEKAKVLTPEEDAMVRGIIKRIIKSHYPGTENMPEVR